MKFVYPIKGKKTADELYKLNAEGDGGFYPIGTNNAYHGGMHFQNDHPVVAIADGQIVAYRYTTEYEEEKLNTHTHRYSSCFVLIRHHFKSPKEQELVFFSLYHHLRPWGACTDKERAAIEIFGKPGYKVTASSLNVRTKMSVDGEDVGDLEHNKPYLATRIDDTWAELEEGPLKGNYFAHTYKGQTLAKPVVLPGEPELDDVVTCNIDVKAGALLGYTGLYESAGIGHGHKTVHVEVFAGKKAESFISNPKKEGKVSHLIIPEKAILKRWKAKADTKADFLRPAGTEVERIDAKGEADWAQVKDTRVPGNVEYAWLNDKYLHGIKHYTAKKAHLADMQAAFPGLTFEAESEENKKKQTSATRFKYVSHDGVDKRNIYVEPGEAGAVYWVKASKLTGSKLARQTECYNCPFELEDGDEVPYEHAVPIKETGRMRHDKRWWYKVKVPKAQGWIARDEVKEATPFDWPGFRILKDDGETYTDLTTPNDTSTPNHRGVDYDKLPEFFKNILAEMDANKDGGLDREEVKLALKQEPIARRLSRLICVHPSEWWADGEKSYWKPLLNSLDKGHADMLEQRIEKLCWWERVKGVDKFPESPAVYHWNPVAFVEQMKTLEPPLYFPLAFIPKESYRQGMRRFGSNRKNGRKHAGCDLYAPVGTKIYAITDGTIIEHAEYYLGTFQITVNHGTFIVRYGEVRPNGLGLAAGLKVGSSVKGGQHLGYVGELRFPSGTVMSMLHLELYSDATKNDGIRLLRNNTPFMRRTDLKDPTTLLDAATKNLPVE